ncbi:MAG TPA: hypothetical protein VK165_11095 [Azonexus sp.]|nr:hypothetical protein [Azonexus sp.]
MSAQIIHLRDRLPSDMYAMLQRFMSGELISLQVTALSKSRQIEHFSFGRTPAALAAIASNAPVEIF